MHQHAGNGAIASTIDGSAPGASASRPAGNVHTTPSPAVSPAGGGGTKGVRPAVPRSRGRPPGRGRAGLAQARWGAAAPPPRGGRARRWRRAGGPPVDARHLVGGRGPCGDDGPLQRDQRLRVEATVRPGRRSRNCCRRTSTQRAPKMPAAGAGARPRTQRRWPGSAPRPGRLRTTGPTHRIVLRRGGPRGRLQGSARTAAQATERWTPPRGPGPPRRASGVPPPVGRAGGRRCRPPPQLPESEGATLEGAGLRFVPRGLSRAPRSLGAVGEAGAGRVVVAAAVAAARSGCRRRVGIVMSQPTSMWLGLVKCLPPGLGLALVGGPRTSPGRLGGDPRKGVTQLNELSLSTGPAAGGGGGVR